MSKGLITQKVLQLKFFLEICCSATLSLAKRWYIVWGSIACHILFKYVIHVVFDKLSDNKVSDLLDIV